ncbi:hypothetical protein KHQ88_03365 [Mycoplasmatota bacterium]|nr:hypothetical protein KHQ88_03365 [Mycoplasmatota bacterium]
MKLRREKIYSHYEVSSIMFYWTMICFLPLVLVFSYTFDVDQVVEPRRYILIILSVNGLLTLFGSLFLFIKKDKLKREVKAHYRGEFLYLIFVSAFAILGFVVLFDYLDGNRDYIANILVLIVVITLILLGFLSKKYFKFDYIKRK